MSLKIPENWTFKNQEVAKHFDNHVREQLPWYDLVSEAVACIVKNYLPRKGLVYDFGCGTGNIGRRLENILNLQEANLIAVDNSLEIQTHYDAPGNFVYADLEEFNPSPFDVGICFLTLMFMSPEIQETFHKRLLKSLKKGGCLIFVEKQETSAGYSATVMWRLIQDAKLKQGVSPEEIILKEMSLIGCQRPISKEIKKKGTQFFQFGDFIGWFECH